MNWEAIGALGEVAGAIAVVVSLVYLAAQIRHNTAQLEEQSRDHELTSMISLESGFSNFRALVAGDAQVASVWHRAQEDLAQLTPEERTQVDYLFREFFWAWANLWVKVKHGDFKARGIRFVGEREGETNFEIEHHVQRKGTRQWWLADHNRELFFTGFAEIIDRMVARHTDLPEASDS